MSIQDVIKLDEQGMKAWDQHDVEGWVAMFADDGILVDPAMPQPLRGKEQLRQYMGAWYMAFPDMRAQSTNRVVAEDSVACEVVFQGTHTGPLQGPPGTPALPPTGRKVTGKGAYFAKLNNGKISEFHSYPDMAGLLMQLGVLGK